MLLSVGGLRKIFFTQNPLTEPPIPLGIFCWFMVVMNCHRFLLGLWDWDPLKWLWPLLFSTGICLFFHLVGDWDWALLQRIILWQWVGEISLCWDIKHIQTKVWKIEMTRLQGCCFLSSVKCSDTGSTYSGLLLCTQVNFYSMFPDHMEVLW